MDYNHESLDTSIIARIAIRDRLDIMEKLNEFLFGGERLFYVEDQAVTELSYVLGSLNPPFTRPQIVEMIESIIYEPTFITNRNRFKAVIKLYATHPKLSFNDCYLAVCAAERDATPLWTLDHKLAIQSAAAKELTLK